MVMMLCSNDWEDLAKVCQSALHVTIISVSWAMKSTIGTVFLDMLSAYHHLAPLRQHCCIYLVLFNVTPLSLALAFIFYYFLRSVYLC